MKTKSLFLSLSTGSALFLGALATAALAGPGPQYWSAPRTPVQPAKAAVAACAGCSTKAVTRQSERGPAGKGVASAQVVGTTHACTFCSGIIVTENNAVKDTMKRDASRCASLTCCK